MVNLPSTRSDALRFKEAGDEIRLLHSAASLRGVAILFVGGKNGVGAGVLRASEDGKTLSWKAPGSGAYGVSHVVESDTELILEDGEDANKTIRLKAWPDFMPTVPVDENVNIQNAYNEVGGDDVTATQASSGYAAEWNITIQNDAAESLYKIRIWIDSEISNLELSWNGNTWYNPDSEYHPDALYCAEMAATETKSLYIRRTTGAPAPAEMDIVSVLHASWEWEGV